MSQLINIKYIDISLIITDKVIKTNKGKQMQRYFECYGINKEGRFDTQYVNFNLIFGNGNATFNPKKNELKKYSSFKSISYFRVIDGEPIYNENNQLIRVQY